MIKIFNGEKEIELNEGSIFDLAGVWNWGVSDTVIFQLENNMEMSAKVINLTGSGTTFKVMHIKANNVLDQIKADSVDATNVEVEIEPDNTNSIIEISKRNSKKDIIEIINKYKLDVNTKLTKKEILASLEKIDNVKLV